MFYQSSMRCDQLTYHSLVPSKKNHNVNYTNYLFSNSYFKVSMNTSNSILHVLFSTSLDLNYKIDFSNLFITLIILCTTRCHEYGKVRKPFIQVVHNLFVHTQMPSFLRLELSIKITTMVHRMSCTNNVSFAFYLNTPSTQALEINGCVQIL
jgi:hypothetical protein